MQPERVIVGRTVLLGPLDPADAPLYARWTSAPALRPFLNRPHGTSVQEERRRVETLVGAPDAIGFAIRLREDERLIGRSAIWNIHPENRSGLFTIFIGDTERLSRGHGREATALTSIHAMETLKLNRLELEVFEYNQRALRCYEGLGYRREGVRREAKFHDGAYHGAIQMAILASEWRNGLRERHYEYLDALQGAGSGVS